MLPLFISLIEPTVSKYYLGLKKRSSIGGDFVPEGIFGNVWRYLWLSHCGVGDAVARGAAKHPRMHRATPQQRIIPPQIAIVPRLRNLGLESSGRRGQKTKQQE